MLEVEQRDKEGAQPVSFFLGSLISYSASAENKHNKRGTLSFRLLVGSIESSSHRCRPRHSSTQNDESSDNDGNDDGCDGGHDRLGDVEGRLNGGRRRSVSRRDGKEGMTRRIEESVPTKVSRSYQYWKRSQRKGGC